MTERCVQFESGGDALLGILHEPDGALREVGVLVVVGGPQYRVGSHRQFVRLARALAEAGFPVLRFDYRGMGDSDGEPRTFDTIDSDIGAGVEALMAAAAGRLQGVVLFGLCDAASAALMYMQARRDERVRGLILANPWVRTQAGEARARVRHYYGERLLQRSFWEKVFRGRFRASQAFGGFVGALRKARSAGESSSGEHFVERMEAGLADFRGPVLLIQSGRDLTAREFDALCETSPRWAELTSRPAVEWARLPDADHTFSTEASLFQSVEITLQWMAVRSAG